MKKQILILFVLLSAIGYTQNGINYKALIKDTNGNIINNQGIDMVFSIQIEGNSVYSELQQIVTDNNGIAIATIGKGSVITGVFEAIDWNLGNTELNVQIDFGDGLIDFGNSPFNAVPYAINTLRPQGLKAFDEGNGVGWRLAERNIDNHGDIGIYAMDLSYSVSESTSRGATGFVSVAMGANTTASNQGSTAMGTGSIASGFNSTAMGSSTSASSLSATAMGSLTSASGNYSTAMGLATDADASFSTAIGRYNLGGGNPQTWVGTDPLFEIGNGIATNKRNALTVLKNGRHTINSSGLAGLDINAPSGTGIAISSLAQFGIYIEDTGFSGLYVDNSQFYGASLFGRLAGVFAESRIDTNPDIILGGTNQDDDGIIASDPSFTGSDIFLRSNDAVVVQLDYDNNEAGNFRIRNGAGAIVFDVNESGNATLSGSLTQNSDRRLKKEIENLDYGLKEILQLQPKQYFWKNQEQDKKKSLGLIAQDVQTIISEIVTSQDDELKTLGISYTELIPVLINAIKEQQKIIESQGSALKTSKSNYEALLSRIEQLEANSSN